MHPPPQVMPMGVSVFLYNCLSETYVILGTMHQDVMNICRSSCKVPDIFVRFAMKLNSFDNRIELFHSEGWTNMTKPPITFINFVNMPKSP
jgi:hypothetical protein